MSHFLPFPKRTTFHGVTLGEFPPFPKVTGAQQVTRWERSGWTGLALNML